MGRVRLGDHRADGNNVKINSITTGVCEQDSSGVGCNRWRSLVNMAVKFRVL
jgi:hypothetical protein